MSIKVFRYMFIASIMVVLAACQQQAAPPDGAVNSVTISPANPTVEVGQTTQLSATVDADAGVAQSVTWESNAEGIATVSDSGLVTGVAAGEAEITATSTVDATKSDTVTVTVTAASGDPAVNSVTIPEGNQTVREGGTFDFSADVDAVGGADETVTWSSSDETVATVDADGVVTGVAAGGPVTITATSAFDSSISDSVQVTVSDVIYVDASAPAGGDGSEGSPYSTIADALAVANAGVIIDVAAGTYNENVSVDKSLTFVGANENTAAGTRGAESILAGDVSIAGDGIDVAFNGFQFRGTSDPTVVSTGVDHNVSYVYNVFDAGFQRLRASAPATFRFENNTANITQNSTSGFVNVGGDYDGSTGTEVTIANNTLTLDLATNPSPAINLSNVSGTVSGNTVDTTQIVAGEDNTNIALIVAGSSGNLTIGNNTFTNANQGIRFYAISAAGLGPVTIDSNTLTGNRQGIVVDASGDLNNVTVTGNTISNSEEGIRLGQAGLSISANAFESATTAYVIDPSTSYDLTAILNDNTFTPAAVVGDVGGTPAIVQQ